MTSVMEKHVTNKQKINKINRTEICSIIGERCVIDLHVWNKSLLVTSEMFF